MEASLGGEKVSESAMHLSEAIDSDCAEARHCSSAAVRFNLVRNELLQVSCNRVYVMRRCFLFFCCWRHKILIY